MPDVGGNCPTEPTRFTLLASDIRHLASLIHGRPWGPVSGPTHGQRGDRGRVDRAGAGVEQWRPAAPPPIHLAGFGAAWFARWGRNLGFFVLNGALSTLFVLPVTIWAALHAPWSRAELTGWPDWAWLPLDVLLLEFWIYWWHRANHEWRFLWRF